MLRLFLLLTLLLYFDEVNEKFPGSQSYLQYASNRLDLKDGIISKWSKIVIDRFYTVNGIYMSIRYNNNMNQQQINNSFSTSTINPVSSSDIQPPPKRQRQMLLTPSVSNRSHVSSQLATSDIQLDLKHVQIQETVHGVHEILHITNLRVDMSNNKSLQRYVLCEIDRYVLWGVLGRTPTYPSDLRRGQFKLLHKYISRVLTCFLTPPLALLAAEIKPTYSKVGAAVELH